MKVICPVCRDSYLEPIPYNILKSSSDASNTTTSSSYTKVKELDIPKFLKGKIKVVFTLATNDSTNAAYGRIYRDGTAIGTERNTTSTSGQQFIENIPVTPATKKIQVYNKIANSKLATTTNFRLYCKAKCLSCGYEDSQRVKHIWSNEKVWTK